MIANKKIMIGGMCAQLLLCAQASARCGWGYVRQRVCFNKCMCEVCAAWLCHDSVCVCANVCMYGLCAEACAHIPAHIPGQPGTHRPAEMSPHIPQGTTHVPRFQQYFRERSVSTGPFGVMVREIRSPPLNALPSFPDYPPRGAGGPPHPPPFTLQ